MFLFSYLLHGTFSVAPRRTQSPAVADELCCSPRSSLRGRCGRVWSSVSPRVLRCVCVACDWRSGSLESAPVGRLRCSSQATAEDRLKEGEASGGRHRTSTRPTAAGIRATESTTAPPRSRDNRLLSLRPLADDRAASPNTARHQPREEERREESRRHECNNSTNNRPTRADEVAAPMQTSFQQAR